MISRNRLLSLKVGDYDWQGLKDSFVKIIRFFELEDVLYKKRVLLKPNLLSSHRPQECVTTHPSFVKALALVLKDNYSCRVSVGDSPSAVFGSYTNIRDLYLKTGMSTLEDVCELVYFKDFEDSEFGPVFSWRRHFDYLINLPKFKTHNLMLLTGAVKNLMGLVLGAHKAGLHLRYPKPQDLAGALSEIYLKNKPLLDIVDAIEVLEGEGPSSQGLPKSYGYIFAGNWGFNVDLLLARILGVGPKRVPILEWAYKRGLLDFDLDIEGDFPVFGGFKLPTLSILYKIPKGLLEFLSRFFKVKVYIEPRLCRSCKICQKSCPKEAIVVENNRLKIKDSQCIMCLCCQEVCPYKAVKTKMVFNFRRF